MNDHADYEAKVAYEWRHRWRALAEYNANRGFGQYSPEFRALMREQQAAFDLEASHRGRLAEDARRAVA